MITIFFRETSIFFRNACRKICVGTFIVSCAFFGGCAGRGTPPQSVVRSYAKACRDGGAAAAQAYLSPEIAESPCPGDDVLNAMRSAKDNDFRYRARLGQAELTRSGDGRYKLRPDSLTDAADPEHALLLLRDGIRQNDAAIIYALFAKSLTDRISIDTLRLSLAEHASIWNAIYAALAAQPEIDMQIGNNSVRCYASDRVIELTVQDGRRKIAAIEGVF